METDAQKEYDKRKNQLEAARIKAQNRIQDEAKAQAEKNAEALNAEEMAQALKAEAEGKASIPAQREGMPAEVVAELDLSNKGSRHQSRRAEG